MPILSSIGLIRSIFGITPTANLLVKIGMYVHIQNFLTFKGTPFNSTHKSPKVSQSGAGSFPKAARAEDERESCGDRCFLTSPLPFLPFFFFFLSLPESILPEWPLQAPQVLFIIKPLGDLVGGIEYVRLQNNWVGK